MFQLYTPLLILQAICLYHAYRTNADQRWYWMIIFIPLVGSVIYLVQHFYNRSNIQSIAEGVKVVVNSNYKTEQLEKALKFSDTVTNRTRLAEAYVTHGRYDEAITLYQNCLIGYMAEDPKIRMKLVDVHHLNKNYAEAIAYGQLLSEEKAFKHSEERIAFAWSLHFSGKSDLAEIAFKEMDRSFTNYRHRAEYCKFLIDAGRTDNLKGLLSELRDELEHMKGPERKLHRHAIRDIKELYDKTFQN